MGSAIGLREDFDGAALRRLSRTTKSANQARRLLALAEIYDGGSRSVAARIGGVGLQIVRDWVIRFNARGPDGLLDGKAPGPRSRLNDVQRQALVDVVESGPIPAIHGVVRWRLIDLVPVARESVIESLEDGVVVLADQRWVVDANPPAARILSQRLEDLPHCAANHQVDAAGSQHPLVVTQRPIAIDGQNYIITLTTPGEIVPRVVDDMVGPQRAGRDGVARAAHRRHLRP